MPKKPKTIDGFTAYAPELAAENDGFKPESHALLYNLEEKSFWFQSRNKLILWAMRRFLKAENAKNYLEMGCGNGFVLKAVHENFPSLECHGSEIYTNGLKFTQKRIPDAELFQMDAREIPFEGKFDIIGAFDVIEHIEEDEKVAGQMFKALRPGGGVIITVPQHPFMWGPADDFACHKRRYTSKELKQKIENAGFKTVKITSFVSLLFPLMMLSRFLDRNRKEYDPENEININKVLNSIFSFVMKIELFFIKLGISFPFGGSLLIVAKKE